MRSQQKGRQMRNEMKSWKLHLLATACGVAMTGSAFAADLPMKSAPMPTAVPYADWTGAYIGLHAGVGSSTSTCGDTGPSTYTGCANYDSSYGASTFLAKDTNFVGGVQAGYDWQNRNFVYGVAADWSWTNLKGNISGGSGSLSYESKVNWLASFRGRMGLAIDSTMVYVTGGLALGGVKDTTMVGTTSYSHESSNTMVGWVAGAGVEHRFDPHWSLVGEFLHYDLGSYTDNWITDGSTYNHKFTHVIDVGRVGVNYRF